MDLKEIQNLIRLQINSGVEVKLEMDDVKSPTTT
jgi:hypothetical protein